MATHATSKTRALRALGLTMTAFVLSAGALAPAASALGVPIDLPRFSAEPPTCAIGESLTVACGGNAAFGEGNDDDCDATDAQTPVLPTGTGASAGNELCIDASGGSGLYVRYKYVGKVTLVR